MKIIDEHETSYSGSYTVVEKGETRYKISFGHTDSSFSSNYCVRVAIVRNFWFNKTISFHEFGDSHDAWTYYKNLVRGFEANDQFK